MDAKAIARETVEALEKGQYIAADGQTIDLTMLLATCLNGTRSYEPDDLSRIREHVLAQPGDQPTTTFAVVNETTLEGCARLAASQQYRQIGVLNFASARNPGGGFLGGARAQEESLARSSGLYFSLRACPEYYTFHRAQNTCLYSDRMIYSPACPVFRDDAGRWRAQPYAVDFITSPAPNAGAIRQNEPENREYIKPVLAERASKILALAAHQGCDALVLGAWGCGVFRNDPRMVAAIFYDYLRPTGLYSNRFRHILFSVYDTSRSRDTYTVFARQFANLF
jgi:uncharacterized protein (TIGR02452 family)